MVKKFITTPIGTAVLPFLFEEDKEYGGFKVSIRVDKPTAESFKKKLMEVVSDHQFKTKNVHIPIVADEKVEGMYLIRTATGYQPGVFDSRNNPIPAKTKVSGGSEVRAIAEVYPYEVQKKEGIKLRLKQVQVIKLVEGGGSSGFDAIEDGFEVIDENEPTFEASDALDI